MRYYLVAFIPQAHQWQIRLEVMAESLSAALAECQRRMPNLMTLAWQWVVCPEDALPTYVKEGGALCDTTS